MSDAAVENIFDNNFEFITLSDLKPHEEHDQNHAVNLASSISKTGRWTTPIIVEEQTGTILDGHHRFEAEKLIQLKRIPAYLVNYGDPSILVTAWRENEIVTRQNVLNAARLGRLMPQKTSKHSFCKTLPTCSVPISELKKEARS